MHLGLLHPAKRHTRLPPPRSLHQSSPPQQREVGEDSGLRARGARSSAASLAGLHPHPTTMAPVASAKHTGVLHAFNLPFTAGNSGACIIHPGASSA